MISEKLKELIELSSSADKMQREIEQIKRFIESSRPSHFNAYNDNVDEPHLIYISLNTSYERNVFNHALKAILEIKMSQFKKLTMKLLGVLPANENLKG